MNSEITRAQVGRPELDRVCVKPVKSMPRKYESSPLACDFMGNSLIHPFLRMKSVKPQSKGSMGRYGSGILYFHPSYPSDFGPHLLVMKR